MTSPGEEAHDIYTRSPNGDWLINGEPPENVLPPTQLAQWYRLAPKEPG